MILGARLAVYAFQIVRGQRLNSLESHRGRLIALVFFPVVFGHGIKADSSQHPQAQLPWSAPFLNAGLPAALRRCEEIQSTPSPALRVPSPPHWAKGAQSNACFSPGEPTFSQLLLFSGLVVPREAVNGSNEDSQEASSSAEDPDDSADDQSETAESDLEHALEEYKIQIARVKTAGSGADTNGSRHLTKDYHGNFFEYLRNEALDALPHQVRQANGTKSVLRRNQFGFNLTGPLKIPRLYEGHGKTFFSVTYEGTREKIARPRLFNIPTDLQHQGDFSDLVDDAGQPVTVYDPLTTRPNPNFDSSQPVSLSNLQYLRDPFPGNRIPRERMDPVALKAVAYYPLPNTNVGPFLRNNFFVNSTETNTPNGTVWKLDHNIGKRHKLSWSGRLSSGLSGAAPIFDNIANPGAPLRDVRSRQMAFSETFNVSPTIVNQVNISAGYSALASNANGGESIDYAGDLGLTGVQPGAFPRFDLTSYVDIGGQPRSTARYQIANYVISDGLSVRYKKHNLKFDFYAYWGQVNSFLPKNPSGLFNFSGSLTSLPGINNTGNSFAQFLLGTPAKAEQSIVLDPSYFRGEQYQFTLTDEYQVTPNFTWNFSLGLQIDTPRHEKYNRQSSLDLSLINPANQRPGALIFAGRDGHPDTFAPTQTNWEPAVSWALNPWGSRKTVIRGSYALSYSYFPLYPTEFGTLGFNASPLIVSANDQLVPAMTLGLGFPQNFMPPPNLTPTAANDTKADYSEPMGILPYDQNWRLEVERDLPADFVVRVAYSGERVTHQYIGESIELNALSPEVLGLRDKLNDLAVNLSLRPYPQFRGISPGYAYPVGSASIHRGSFRVEKRFSHGLNFTASYLLSKSIDDVLSISYFSPRSIDEGLSGNSPQNSSNLRVEKAITPYDMTHQFSINYLYELPFGEGRPFLSSGGIVNGVIGGWSFSGLTTFRTGTPVILSPLFNNTGQVAEALRVNVIPGVDPRVPNPSASQWFNPAAFDQPPDFTLGNGPRTMPALRNPGAQNFDMSLTKRVPITQDWTLEVIMEAFNSFNHANLNKPDGMIGSVANPNLNAGKIVGSTGGRVIQMGLRFSF